MAVYSYAASSAPLARRRMAADLAASGVPAAAVDDAELVLSELVGNAVRHGHPLPGDLVDVSWQLHDRDVIVRVTDGGTGDPRRRASGDDAESGRGLSIVSALARDWGVEHLHGGGTSVWARVGL